MDKYIYEDINYVIINDKIEYKFEIKSLFIFFKFVFSISII